MSEFIARTALRAAGRQNAALVATGGKSVMAALVFACVMTRAPAQEAATKEAATVTSAQAREALDRADVLFNDYMRSRAKQDRTSASDAWRKAVDAFGEITRTFDSSEIAANAWMRLSALHKMESYCGDALNDCLEVTRRFPGSSKDTWARYVMADIYLHSLKDAPKAIAWLCSIREPDASPATPDQKEHDDVYRSSRLLLCEAYAANGQAQLRADVYRALDDRYPQRRDEFQRHRENMRKMTDAHYNVNLDAILSESVSRLGAEPVTNPPPAASQGASVAAGRATAADRQPAPVAAAPIRRHSAFVPTVLGIVGCFLLTASYILRRKEKGS